MKALLRGRCEVDGAGQIQFGFIIVQTVRVASNHAQMLVAAMLALALKPPTARVTAMAWSQRGVSGSCLWPTAAAEVAVWANLSIEIQERHGQCQRQHRGQCSKD